MSGPPYDAIEVEGCGLTVERRKTGRDGDAFRFVLRDDESGTDLLTFASLSDANDAFVVAMLVVAVRARAAARPAALAGLAGFREPTP